jgi:ABC-2 type transport system permease protein
MRDLHGWTRFLYELNPLVGIFELHRAVWFPKHFVSWTPVYFSIVGSLIVFLVGWWTFIRVERSVLKEL